MSNEEYLINLYNSYPNAHYFTIKDNKLVLEIEDRAYELPIKDFNLSKINPNIFLLKPVEAFQIIYLLLLLTQDIIDKNEENIVTNYTFRYIELSNKVNTFEDSNIQLEHSLLSIPMYTADDPLYINKPASRIIRSMLDNYALEQDKEESEKGGRGNSRVLKNPNGSINFDEGNNFIDYSKAGFVTLVLILGAVAITVTYITTYILNK